MKVLVVIPARMESTRLPGKLLMDLGGKPVIQRVYDQVRKSDRIDQVVVATDNTEISDHMSGIGAKVFQSKEAHSSGTSRCIEAALQLDFDIMINVQADEPFLNPFLLGELIDSLDASNALIATPVSLIDNLIDLQNPNVVKVVMDHKKRALYFSRSTIPYLRTDSHEELLKKRTFYRHIGIYAFKQEAIAKIKNAKPSELADLESLEQLAWLQNSMPIQCLYTSEKSIGIDTLEDLEAARKRFS